MIERTRFAVGPVVAAMVVLAVVLAVVAPFYGYHRDELYFRMLPPAWGYIDQPPLIPLLAGAAAAVLGDTVFSLRIVPIVCAVGSIPLLVLITREVGGSRLAQTFTAWGMAGATMTLLFGHVLLTASLDLVVWPATLFCVIRAVLRDDGRWWLVAGAIAGASSFNKLLIAVLLIGVFAGLIVCGPRRWLASGWLWGGVAIAAALAAPNIVYQALHGWPQFAMGAALGENNADEVRVMMWPFLVLLVGPVLAVFWIAGLIGLFRRPPWRSIRLVAVAFAILVAFVFIAGTQFHYTAGMLGVLTALGAVPVAEWAGSAGRRRLIAAGLAVNAVGCVITSLPVLPVTWFGVTGLSAVNTPSGDQVGWERYVAHIEEVAAESRADAIITSNYGEAGALDRFGDGLVPVVSGHNALWDLGGPPGDARTVVIVGGQLPEVEASFEECAIAGRLDNGVGVDNEEEGMPIAVCTEPVLPWEDLWPRFRHLD